MAKVGTPGAISAPPLVSRHLGQGIKYPPEYDSAGRLKLSHGTELVTESLESIANTAQGERVMQPDYGAAAMAFEPIDDGRLELILRNAVAAHEPRVDSFKIAVGYGTNGDAVEMKCEYTLVGDITPRTLVIPFYQVETDG